MDLVVVTTHTTGYGLEYLSKFLINSVANYLSSLVCPDCVCSPPLCPALSCSKLEAPSPNPIAPVAFPLVVLISVLFGLGLGL
eukprot:827594-Karenia_brevis.AAC.1